MVTRRTGEKEKGKRIRIEKKEENKRKSSSSLSEILKESLKSKGVFESRSRKKKTR
jgi:hypothetical protein